MLRKVSTSFGTVPRGDTTSKGHFGAWLTNLENENVLCGKKSMGQQPGWCPKKGRSILEPLAPDTTIDLKLLYSDRDFWAEEPVLSRASLRMRFTWFSKVCRRVFPGVGSSSLLCAFSMTCVHRSRLRSQGDVSVFWSPSLQSQCPLHSSVQSH